VVADAERASGWAPDPTQSPVTPQAQSDTALLGDRSPGRAPSVPQENRASRAYASLYWAQGRCGLLRAAPDFGNGPCRQLGYACARYSRGVARLRLS
jgi:hypothetical protein